MTTPAKHHWALQGVGLPSPTWDALDAHARATGLSPLPLVQTLPPSAPSATILVVPSTWQDELGSALAAGFAYGVSADLPVSWIDRVRAEADRSGAVLGWCFTTRQILAHRQTPLLLDRLVAEGVITVECRGDVDLLLTEALANAALHGNLRIAAPNDPYEDALAGRGVGVFASLDGDSLWWRVWQEGDGSADAIQKLDDLLAGQTPDLENPGGRGLFIISRLAQAVQFEDHGRCLAIRTARR